MKFSEASQRPIILGAELLKPASNTLDKSLDNQAPSTKAILTRSLSDDSKAQARIVSTSVMVKDKDGNPDVAPRVVTSQEVVLQEAVRHNGRNNQQIDQNIWVDGENVNGIQLSATSSQKKEKAVDAFMYTPPANLNEQEMKRLTLYTQLKELETLPKEHKLSWLDKLLIKMRVKQADTSDRYSYAELQELWDSMEKKK